MLENPIYFSKNTLSYKSSKSIAAQDSYRRKSFYSGLFLLLFFLLLMFLNFLSDLSVHKIKTSEIIQRFSEIDLVNYKP